MDVALPRSPEGSRTCHCQIKPSERPHRSGGGAPKKRGKLGDGADGVDPLLRLELEGAFDLGCQSQVFDK